MHPQPHLGPDLEVRQLDEHLERVGDPAVGRVLQWDHAELDVPAVDLLEDRGDRADRDMLDGLAKLGDRGQVAVAVLRAQAGDPHRPLQGPRAAHQLAEDSPQGLRRHRAPAGRERLGDHLVLARRRPDLQAPILLELADPKDDLRPSIQQTDELMVQPVDLLSQARQAGHRLRGRSPPRLDSRGRGKTRPRRRSPSSSMLTSDSLSDRRLRLNDHRLRTLAPA